MTGLVSQYETQTFMNQIYVDRMVKRRDRRMPVQKRQMLSKTRRLQLTYEPAIAEKSM